MPVLLALATATHGQAPLIITPPEDQTVPIGGTARFSVAATGAEPLSYHWLSNGSVVVAAQGPTGLSILFDADGQKLWSSNYSSGMTPIAVATDAMTNVWVSGSGSNGLLVLKQDHTGRELWASNHPAGLVLNSRTRSALACDSSGQGIVATYPGYVTDLIITKLGPEGQTVWRTNTPVASFGMLDWQSWPVALAVVLNSADDAFVTASIRPSPTLPLASSQTYQLE